MTLALVNLTAGGMSGGYVKYLRQMVPLIAADARVRRLDVWLPPALPADLIPGVEALSWPAGDALTGFRALRQRLARTRPDVVFVPTARWLDTGGIPTVVMVRNMEP